MNTSFFQFFYRKSSWITVAILFCIFIFLGWLQQNYPVGFEHLEIISEGIEPLDTSEYTVDEVYPRLESLSHEALSFYLRVLLTMDMVFPLLFRIMLICAGIMALKGWLPLEHPLSFLYWLTFLPFSSMIADILENSLIAVMIVNLPHHLSFPAVIVSFLTPYKWTSNYIEWSLLAFLWILGISMRIINKIGKEKADA